MGFLDIGSQEDLLRRTWHFDPFGLESLVDHHVQVIDGVGSSIE